MINLLRFPPFLGAVILGLGMNNCPAEPGRAVGLAKAEPAAGQNNVFGMSLLVKLMAERSD
ncbi:MAG: hypothetical protein WAM44_14665 [Chthoniobacterales bacterium]